MSYQFMIDGRPAGPVRATWQDAGSDAVEAKMAHWQGAHLLLAPTATIELVSASPSPSPSLELELRVAALEKMAHPPVNLRPEVERIVRDVLAGETVEPSSIPPGTDDEAVRTATRLASEFRRHVLQHRLERVAFCGVALTGWRS